MLRFLERQSLRLLCFIRWLACWIWHWFAIVVSGEFILCLIPNGGGAILFRTLWVTAIVYGVAVLSLCVTDRGSALVPWPTLALYHIHHSLAWIGAIAGGVYLALYARFAAQWAYLAGLYNEIMAVCVCTNPWSEQAQYLAVWRAGFISDAISLHLATKPTIALIIHDLLTETAVKKAFADACYGDESVRRVLPSTVRNAIAAAIRHERKCIRELNRPRAKGLT